MRHQRRIERLERRWRTTVPRLAIVVVRPDEWPEADRADFDSDDLERRDAAIERQTGQRLGSHVRLLVIQRWADGPP
jgi:hypothetical protein